MMQNFGARLKYTEQYCMSDIKYNIAASCSLGSKHWHTSLASQRVKGYHKNAHGTRQLSIHEKKPLSSHDCRKLASGLSEEGGGSD